MKRELELVMTDRKSDPGKYLIPNAFRGRAASCHPSIVPRSVEEPSTILRYHILRVLKSANGLKITPKLFKITPKQTRDRLVSGGLDAKFVHDNRALITDILEDVVLERLRDGWVTGAQLARLARHHEDPDATDTDDDAPAN